MKVTWDSSWSGALTYQGSLDGKSSAIKKLYFADDFVDEFGHNADDDMLTMCDFGNIVISLKKYPSLIKIYLPTESTKIQVLSSQII